jgi:hypothetical protein
VLGSKLHYIQRLPFLRCEQTEMVGDFAALQQRSCHVNLPA